MPSQFRRLRGLVALLALALAAPAAAEEADAPTHIIHPFGSLRADYTSNTGGTGIGTGIFRVTGGATYRYDLPGGTSFALQYQAQYVTLSQFTTLSSVLHVATGLISHNVPITTRNLLADSFTPYIGAQLLYHMPTGDPTATSSTDSDYFLGFSFLKNWTREHLLWYGLHVDYFGPQDRSATSWGAAGILGYRWIPSALVEFTADNRVEWRSPTDRRFGNVIREELSVDVDIFPFPWLSVGPGVSLAFDTGSQAWTWTAGVNFSSNLWYTR